MSAASNVNSVINRIFFANGIITSLEEANAMVKVIRTIVREKAEVELHFNDTTPKEKVDCMKGKAITGLALIIEATKLRKKTIHEKKVAIVVRELGLRLIRSIVNDFEEIQCLLDESAQDLADKIDFYLDDPNFCGNVTLILHSQGADIGRRALQQLEKHQGRINVITLGGMVDIPDELANRVENFIDDKDWIAYFAKEFFGTHTNEVIKNDQCASIFCHGALEYLKTPRIQQTIVEFNKPNLVGL